MKSIFKIYDKENGSNQCDTVFSIIGRNEPDLTKSLAFLLHYKNELLVEFLKIIDNTIDNNFIKVIISAEQKPDLGLDNNRRDIGIKLYYLDSEKNTLIIIEAKNLFHKNISSNAIINQLSKYFDSNSYSDLNYMNRKIAVTLTKNKLLFSSIDNQSFQKIKSIKWQDVIQILTKFDDYLINSYQIEIMNSNFIKTYEEEVFCPPVGDTYSKVENLSIYCCPADRSLKESIYLLPRIPVNANEGVLKEKYQYDDESIKRIKGKGFSIALYKIETSFIVDSDSLDAIDDSDLRDKVQQWGLNQNERLKVFVLNEKMDFKEPKITDLQNNAWNGYFKLSDIWGNLITKNMNAQQICIAN